MFDCKANKIHILVRLGVTKFMLEQRQLTFKHEVNNYEQMLHMNTELSVHESAKYIDSCTNLYITDALLDYVKTLYKNLMAEDCAK